MDIRAMTDPEELSRASQLEATIWGAADPTPRSLLVVFSRHGGIVLGAYDGSTIVGLTVGFPALDSEHRWYLHSQLLGVLPAYRGKRVGEALKRAQWQFCASSGRMAYIGWTFDPLMAPNAWFNLAVLGAEVTQLERNLYGRLQDAINGSMPTHRLWVTWNPLQKKESVKGVQSQYIPPDVLAVREANPTAAEAMADAFFEEMQARWSEGLRIVGVGRDPNGVCYQWGKRGQDNHEN